MSRRMTVLARVVKAYLDLAFFLLLLIGAILIVVTPFVIADAPNIRDADVGMAVRFVIDEAVLAGSAPRSEEVVPARVEGEGTLRVSSASRLVWAGFMLSLVFGLAAMIFVLHQLRALFRTVAGGSPFARENAVRIKRVGWMVIAWQLVVPLAKYLVGRMLVGEMSIRGVTLEPPVDFNPEALFLGLAILVLAEIFRQASELKQEASELKQEQSLTI